MPEAQLVQIETSKPGGSGDPVGRHFLSGQLAAELASGEEDTAGEGEYVPFDDEDGRRGD